MCSLAIPFTPMCTRAQRAVPAAVIASSMIEIESHDFPSTHAMLCSHFNNIVEQLQCWPASYAAMIKIAQVIHQIYACTRKFNKSQWFDFSIFSLSNREMMVVGWSKKPLKNQMVKQRNLQFMCYSLGKRRVQWHAHNRRRRTAAGLSPGAKQTQRPLCKAMREHTGQPDQLRTQALHRPKPAKGSKRPMKKVMRHEHEHASCCCGFYWSRKRRRRDFDGHYLRIASVHCQLFNWWKICAARFFFPAHSISQ